MAKRGFMLKVPEAVPRKWPCHLLLLENVHSVCYFWCNLWKIESEGRSQPPAWLKYALKENRSFSQKIAKSWYIVSGCEKTSFLHIENSWLAWRWQFHWARLSTEMMMVIYGKTFAAAWTSLERLEPPIKWKIRHCQTSKNSVIFVFFVR